MQNTKRESQIQHGVGVVGYSINCGLQRQALLTASHSHPESSKIQITNIYNPTGLLTKIKSQVPNEPGVGRPLEDQGQSDGNGQVKTGREKTEGKGHSGKRQAETARKQPEGPRQSEKRQLETEAAQDRPPRSFQKQCFQFNGMALRANMTYNKVAEALTYSRAHTHPHIIYLFIHNRYKCLSEIRKGINSQGGVWVQGGSCGTGQWNVLHAARRAA